MLFKWSQKAVILVKEDLRLNKFSLMKTEHENVNVNDGIRHGHKVVLKLTFKREYGYYIYQVQHCSVTKSTSPN